MKARLFSIVLTFIFTSTLYLSYTFAQSPTQGNLIQGEKVLQNDKGRVRSVAYSPDSTLLAAGTDNNIWIYDTSGGEELHLLRGHTDWVLSVSFSPDGKTLASGSLDRTVRLWDVEMGTLKRTITEHEGYVTSVSFKSDGKVLASGSFDGTMRRWVVETGVRHQAPITADRDGVRAVSFSPHGSTLAFGGENGNLIVWNTETGVLWNDAEPIGRIYSASFSPDGKTLAVAGDRMLHLWDIETGEWKATLTGHIRDVLSVSFSPDGKMLASGSVDETVRLWDVETGELKTTLTKHTSWVYSVSFSPDGKTLASGGDDGTVLLWDLAPAPPELEPEPEPEPEPPRLAADVTGDSQVNIQDLVFVAAAFGETGETPADVNGDGTVSILDLVAVAAAFGQTAAGAPSVLTLSRDREFAPTRAEVEGWLTQAQRLDLTDAISQRGILFLEQLLLTLTPKETALLANYPNPFNPETWIPYQLAAPADVTLRIYAVDGSLVRTLSVGHKPTGIYQSRGRAAYWDGKNAIGEPVASGVYFYTLSADDFVATRKMLIRK